jgi:hypothetical protein
MNYLMRRSLVTSGLFGMTLFVSNPSLAQTATAQSAPVTLSEEDLNRARNFAIMGFEALDGGNFSSAASLFTQALELLDVPTLRVGRGDALVQLNRWRAALADYEAAAAYVLKADDSPAIRESHTTAAIKAQELKPRLPRLRVDTTAPHVRVTVDDEAQQTLSRDGQLYVDPGSHSVRVELDGEALTTEVEAAPGAELRVPAPQPTPAELTLTGSSDSVPEPTSNDALFSDEVLVAGAITGVLAVGFAVTGILFDSNHATYRRLQDGELPSTESRRQGLRDDLVTLQWVNLAFAAGAVVGAGVTSYFWFAPTQSETQTAGPAPRTPFASPNGFVLGASGRF